MVLGGELVPAGTVSVTTARDSSTGYIIISVHAHQSNGSAVALYPFIQKDSRRGRGDWNVVFSLSGGNVRFCHQIHIATGY